jgi:tryptophan halogenase
MTIKSVLIVGGGTAGLTSALILKNRFPKLIVDVVKSDDIGIIGVGEGSTEHWKEFSDFCGFTLSELISETKATFKFGIMFEEWTKKPYFHNVTGSFNDIRYGMYLGGYAYATFNNLTPEQYTNSFCFKNKIILNNYPNQFHFNTFKLNEFLLNKCLKIGINIYEDTISDIIINENGNIKNIKSNSKDYIYDFYIDSTGFKKILISKLGAKWISYKEYLPMNEAIAFPTEDTEEYTPYTLSRAMSSGWMWRIPTYGRWGNGYVFNNNYINADQAKKECEDYLGFKVEIAKNIKFEAGKLDKPWIKNCVAIGLSSSFIEPLEATSIGISIQQSFLLMHLLINYNETDIKLYNDTFKDIVENTRDFVVLHYMVDKKDSKFWKELKLNIPESLLINLKKWRYRLPINEDFKTNYALFKESNFSVLLKELNLIDKEFLKKEYDMLNDSIKNDIQNKINNLIYYHENSDLISHKKFLMLYTATK